MAPTGTTLSIEVEKCNEQTVLPSGQTCASEEEAQTFFNYNTMYFITLRNFIDYDDVNFNISSDNRPIQSMFELADT